MNKQPSSEDRGWIIAPENLPVTASMLEEELISCRNARVAEGRYTLEDVRYVSNLTLGACKGELRVSNEKLEKLRRLCQLWDVKLRPREIQSHRKIIGPVIVGVKKAIYPLLKFFLKDMLHQQREFNAACIRMLAEVARDEEEIARRGRDAALQRAPEQKTVP